MRLVRAIAVCAPIAIAAGVFMAPSRAAAVECSVSAGDLSFGPVDTLSSLGTAAATDITVTCDQISSGVETVTMCGSLGAGTGGTGGGYRRLSPGTDAPLYGLYSDAGHTQPWGDGTLGDTLRLTLQVVDGEASAIVGLYGLVFGSQAEVPPGQYESELSGADATFYYEEGDVLDCSGSQSSSATLLVTAEVLANCLIAAGDLDFGTTGLIDRDIDAAADLAITCTPQTGFSISLDGGISGATAPDARLMHSGGDTISYGLYMDAARQQPWGDGALVQSGEGSGQQEMHTVYGRVPPQAAPVGTYTDTVVVTITYE